MRPVVGRRALWSVLVVCMLFVGGCGDPIAAAIKDWNVDTSTSSVDLKDPKHVPFLISAVGDSFRKQAQKMGFDQGFAAGQLVVEAQVRILKSDDWAKLDAGVDKAPPDFRSLYKKWKATVQDLQEIQQKQAKQ